MEFKAAMFDFDGTLTEKGAHTPSLEMVDTLLRLSKKIPIAFCTGREIGSFVHGSFAVLLEQIERTKRFKFLENLFLFVENGSIGYRFDSDKGNFVELYRVKWPDHFIKKSELKAHLLPKISDFGDLFDHGHEICFVLQSTPKNGDKDINYIYSLSQKIYDICIDFFAKIDPDFEKHLHVGNSGIGVVIGPAEGDKDYAIKRFAKILAEQKGFEFDKNATEILVAGDSHFPGGNDFYFLKGKYGTPFTVGPYPITSELPSPVIDSNGRKLYHEKGTNFLIKSLFDL
jgi:hydroxymethylpyrimidine pyrophosphatase-like HAD family hydrolase